MSHQLCLTSTEDSGSVTFYYFEPLAPPSRGGWCYMRLMRVNWYLGWETPHETHGSYSYDPAIHDEGGTDMSYPFRARSRLRRGRRTYTLVGAFGNPGIHSPLKEVTE